MAEHGAHLEIHGDLQLLHLGAHTLQHLCGACHGWCMHHIRLGILHITGV